MPLPTLFAGLSNATGAELDGNFAALAALTAIPCTVAGTNVLTLTPLSTTPTVAAYSYLQGYSGVASATNTGPATATVTASPALSVLPVYRDTNKGPVALVGGEIIIGTMFVLVYDSALQAGGGGFHLMTLLMPPVYSQGALPVVNANAGTTLTAAQLTGNGTGRTIILRQGAPGGDFNDQTDSAANIVAALPGASVNGSTSASMFFIRVVNTSGHTQTLTAGSGVNVNSTNATTANGATHDFVGVVTNVGTPAVTIYG